MSYDFGNGIIIDEVKNPRWGGDEVINVDIDHPVYGKVGFTAMPTDPVDYGRQIYADCLAGKWGTIRAAETKQSKPITSDQR